MLTDLQLLLLLFSFVTSGRAAEFWFKEAKERLETLNAIIYGNIIYANWCVCSFQLLFSLA